jgi:antitoxin CptB
MLHAEQNRDAEQRRLAWRCRRGLLELDIVLQRFIATNFDDLTTQELMAFDDLLAMPDNDFWNLISTNSLKKNNGKDVAFNSVIKKLNAR